MIKSKLTGSPFIMIHGGMSRFEIFALYVMKSFFENFFRCNTHFLKDKKRTTTPNSIQGNFNFNFIAVRVCFQENGRCLNGCCQSKPCLNGGTCAENCDDIRKQYNCTCPQHYQGKRCEIFHPRVNSCLSYLKLKPESKSGVYKLNDTAQSYCDFDSKPGKVWTLIESFSLGNKDFYNQKPFYYNFPRNETRFNWNDYRVSYQAMVNIRHNSTHWRVTCNFPSGLNFTDYARATLQDTDILTFVNQDSCQRYEYISVRGRSCTNCSGMLVQRDTQHMHTDSYWSGKNGCSWDPSTGALEHEDNFGFYDIINPKHKCTENSFSTTQWWLGAEL